MNDQAQAQPRVTDGVAEPANVVREPSRTHDTQQPTTPAATRDDQQRLAPAGLLASSRVLTELADIRNTNFNFCSPESVKDMICKRVEAAEILDLKEIASNAALLANGELCSVRKTE